MKHNDSKELGRHLKHPTQVPQIQLESHLHNTEFFQAKNP